MRFLATAVLAVCPLIAAQTASSDLEQARKLYQYTDYEGSLKILQTIEPKDGTVHALIGQNHYMQGEYKKATESLERAVGGKSRITQITNSGWAVRLVEAGGNGQPIHRCA